MTQLVSFDSYYNKASVMTVYFRKDLYTCCISSYIIIYIDNVTNMVSFTIYHTYMHPTFSKHTGHSLYTLVIYTHSLVIYTHSLVIYTHSLVIYTHSLAIYTNSPVIYTHSLTHPQLIYFTFIHNVNTSV